MNKDCPAPDVLAAFASGELAEDSKPSIAAHVSHCDTCLEVVGYLTSKASQPTSPAGVFRPPLAERDQVIGAYRLIRRIGEGGMGEVWEAQQTAPVRRTVALKLLKAGMDTRQIIARFEAERQMLALMQHPSIAQIFDAGVTEVGRPYFVMEYVEGVRITAYCDAYCLGIRERLELFKQVCAAVQHAHQKGVIHRDLKPSNVLVTTDCDKPLPKVIDFGLAKATTTDTKDQSLTELGTLLGTPAYASPEQMSLGALDIDTRSDVYSLGILLYELLVGVLPFEADGAQPLAIVELRRAIREQEPARPSSRIARLGDRISSIARARGADVKELRKQLRADLDWVVMKALEKERDRRYASPHELSLDIDHYLHHEPLQARPPTTGYRMRKFVRRHRIGTAFAAMLALLIASFVVVTIVQSQRIATERDRATAEANKANSINAFLQETLGSADPWETGKDVSIREVLANAGKKADAELADQPLIAAAVKSTIGNAYTGLGQFDDAEKLLEQSLHVRQRLLESPHVDIAESFEMLAELHRSKSDYEQSSRFAGEALGIYRTLYGEDHALTARTMVLLAEQLDLQSKYQDAERIGTQALTLLERRFGTDSPELLEALKVVGSIASELGDFSRSEQLLTRAIDISQRAYGAQDLRTSLRINELAVLNFRSNKTAEAARLYAEVVRIQDDTLGPGHPTTLIAKENLAGALVGLRRFDEALGLLNEVLAGRKAKLGEQAPPVVRTMANMANLQAEIGHYDESIALYERVLPLFAAAYGIEHADNAFLQACLGRVLRMGGQAKRAESVLRSELSRQPSRMAGNDLYRALAQYELGMALLDLRAYEEAESNLLPAYHTRLERYGATNVRTRAAADALVKLYTAVGNPDKVAAFTASEATR